MKFALPGFFLIIPAAFPAGNLYFLPFGSNILLYLVKYHPFASSGDRQAFGVIPVLRLNTVIKYLAV